MLHRKAFTLLEVLIAMVLLGLVLAAFSQSTIFAKKNISKGHDWMVESAIIEKTVENLRTDYTVSQLQSLDMKYVDAETSGPKMNVTVKGSIPPTSIATNFPPNMLAQLDVTVGRVNSRDTLAVRTIVWTGN